VPTPGKKKRTDKKKGQATPVFSTAASLKSSPCRDWFVGKKGTRAEKGIQNCSGRIGEKGWCSRGEGG